MNEYIYNTASRFKPYYLSVQNDLLIARNTLLNKIGNITAQFKPWYLSVREDLVIAGRKLHKVLSEVHLQSLPPGYASLVICVLGTSSVLFFIYVIFVVTKFFRKRPKKSIVNDDDENILSGRPPQSKAPSKTILPSNVRVKLEDDDKPILTDPLACFIRVKSEDDLTSDQPVSNEGSDKIIPEDDPDGTTKPPSTPSRLQTPLVTTPSSSKVQVTPKNDLASDHHRANEDNDNIVPEHEPGTTAKPPSTPTRSHKPPVITPPSSKAQVKPKEDAGPDHYSSGAASTHNTIDETSRLQPIVETLTRASPPKKRTTRKSTSGHKSVDGTRPSSASLTTTSSETGGGASSTRPATKKSAKRPPRKSTSSSSSSKKASSPAALVGGDAASAADAAGDVEVMKVVVDVDLGRIKTPAGRRSARLHKK